MTMSIITPQDERFEGTVIINNEYDSLVTRNVMKNDWCKDSYSYGITLHAM